MTEQRKDGAALVEALESWFASYMAFPDPAYALICALWTIHTHCFTRFYSIPYLAITARTKGAGKTTLLKLLGKVCRDSWTVTAASSAPLFRRLLDKDGVMTLLYDEAEVTGSEQKNPMSQFLNSGYTKGQTIPKVVGGRVVDYPAFCPKVFAMIGDPNSTVRDRCIVLSLERAHAPRDFWPETAENEGIALTEQIRKVLSETASVAAEYPDYLAPRDREIWGAMFGLATALGLPKATRDRLTMAAADNAASKTAPKRKAHDVENEEDAIDGQYAGKALADLRRVLKDGERGIFSAVAVERMRALPDGPWRAFKGVGLDQTMLSALVARFGVQPVNLKIAGKVQRGYKVVELSKASKA